MLKYVIRRVLYCVPVLFAISIISFTLMQFAPGDFLTEVSFNAQLSDTTITNMRTHYALNLPVWRRYLLWLSSALQGDLGVSYTYNLPVRTLVASRALNTVLLVGTASLIAWLLALPLGVYSAVHRNSLPDRVCSVISYCGLSIPPFFLGLLLTFAVVEYNLPIPLGGATSIEYAWLSWWEKLADRFMHLLIPMTTLTMASMAHIVRYMRSSTLDVLHLDYIATARAKGLSEATVVIRHACRNSINPLITLLGFEIGGLLSGAALVENVTGWPGLGSVVLDAVLARDHQLVMGSLLVGSVLLMLGNLIADCLLALNDRRICYDETASGY